MIRLLGCLILFVFLCVLSISCADNQKGKKENLEMQAMCSKGAKDFFNKNYPEPLALPENSNGYTNHYDSKLNKCFILINTHLSSGPVGNPNQIVSDATFLYDAYEGKEYATLSTYKLHGENNTPPYCEVLGKLCNEKDFQNLIKLYMEE